MEGHQGINFRVSLMNFKCSILADCLVVAIETMAMVIYIIDSFIKSANMRE